MGCVQGPSSKCQCQVAQRRKLHAGRRLRGLPAADGVQLVAVPPRLLYTLPLALPSCIAPHPISLCAAAGSVCRSVCGQLKRLMRACLDCCPTITAPSCAPLALPCLPPQLRPHDAGCAAEDQGRAGPDAEPAPFLPRGHLRLMRHEHRRHQRPGLPHQGGRRHASLLLPRAAGSCSFVLLSLCHRVAAAARGVFACPALVLPSPVAGNSGWGTQQGRAPGPAFASERPAGWSCACSACRLQPASCTSPSPRAPIARRWTATPPR